MAIGSYVVRSPAGAGPGPMSGSRGRAGTALVIWVAACAPPGAGSGRRDGASDQAGSPHDGPGQEQRDDARDGAPESGPAGCGGRSGRTPACTAQPGSIWCTNVRVSDGKGSAQSEPSLGVDGMGRIAVSWMNGHADLRLARSTADFSFAGSESTGGNADPTFAASGKRLFFGYLAGLTPTVTWSDDGGTTWSREQAVGYGDRPWLIVGPGGEVWIGYFKFPVGALDFTKVRPTLLRFDEASSRFKEVASFAPLVGKFAVGADGPPAVDADGWVHWLWGEDTPDGDVALVLARSADGKSFDRRLAQTVRPPPGEKCNGWCRDLLGSMTSMVASGGRQLYLANVAPAAAGSRDLLVRTSTDHGEKWSAPRRANETEGAVVPFMPQFWMVADACSEHLAWYEQHGGKYAVYARSGTGVARRVSDAEFTMPKPWSTEIENDRKLWPGHFFGLAASAGHLYVAWADLRAGFAEIYFARTAVPVD